MIGAGSGWKMTPKSPLQQPNSPGKSRKAQLADEMWQEMGSESYSARNGGGGMSQRNTAGGKSQLQFAPLSNAAGPQSLEEYRDGGLPPTTPPRPPATGRHAQVDPAFRAYHNYHTNNGPTVIAANTSSAFAATADPAERARVLEEDYYPLRQRGKAQQMVKEMRDPNHLLGGGDAQGYIPKPAIGPSTYTYTGGFASTVFSSSTNQDLTEDEQREVYRQRHRQAYSALASVKPFLQRLFEDEDAELDTAEVQQRQSAALAAEQQQRLLGIFGSDDAVTSGGLMLDGGVSATAPNNGLNQSHPVDTSGSPNISSTVGQQAPVGGSMSRSLYGSQTTNKLGKVYAKQPMASAVNALPSWHYQDLVRREAAKPLILNTIVTTDRCPLTTKTCPPTYTTFNTLDYTAAAKDAEAFSYFSHVAATGSGAASQAKERARRLGGSSTSVVSRMNQPLTFSAEKGAGEEAVVVNGTLQNGSLNVGMRVFRDFLLPQDGPLLLNAGGTSGRSQQKDDKTLLAEAHLAFLKRVIHDSKPVSERNHIAPAIDYDRW